MAALVLGTSYRPPAPAPAETAEDA
jgi:hypothetical protein